MALATIAKIGDRVAWVIGARLSAGTYGSGVDTTDDDRFADNEIKTAIVETETEIVRDVCEANHSRRNDFLALSSVIANGASIPEHIGQIESIHIEPYSSAGYSLAEKTTRTNIRLWRENVNNRFDAINHDQSGSKLSNYYSLDNNIIEYTGLNAKANICTYTPDFATYVLQLDDLFANALVAGSVPKLLKLGIPANLVQHYQGLYDRARNSIRSGSEVLPDIEIEQKID